MIALAIPFFALQLGSSDQGSDPTGSTTRIGYDLISSEFGVGYNSTLEAVVSGPGASDQAYLAAGGAHAGRRTGVDRTSLSVGAADQQRRLRVVQDDDVTAVGEDLSAGAVTCARTTLPPL